MVVRVALRDATVKIPEETKMAETVREAFTRLIAENPQFKEAPRTGQAVTIGGGRPAVGADARLDALKLSASVAGQHCGDAENLAGPKVVEAAFVGEVGDW
jgi:hypothetical protein